MNIDLRQSLITCALLIHFGVPAQSVFTYTDFAPQQNDQYTVTNAQYISPGSGGANQTWNFSAAVTNTTTTYSVNPVSAIQCGNQFAGATLGLGTGAYDMLQVTVSEYNCEGNSLTPAMADFVYADHEKRFVFPMNFNDSFSDVFYGTSNAMQTINRNGNNTVTYDGYGTIITPIGTYTNVIRLHRQVSWADSMQTGTDVCSGNYYYWFVAGTRYPVAQIWSVNCSGGPSLGAMFLQSVTIGQEEWVVQPLSFVVFPNPVSSALTIQCTTGCVGKSAMLADVSGRVVRTFTITSTSMDVNVNDLENGIYFLFTENSAPRRFVKSLKD